MQRTLTVSLISLPFLSIAMHGVSELLNAIPTF